LERNSISQYHRKLELFLHKNASRLSGSEVKGNKIFFLQKQNSCIKMRSATK
jgi:hypothetical protein